MNTDDQIIIWSINKTTSDSKKLKWNHNFEFVKLQGSKENFMLHKKKGYTDGRRLFFWKNGTMI